MPYRFAIDARREYAKRYDSELIERVIDGLRKAGLEIAKNDETTVSSGTAAAASTHFA